MPNKDSDDADGILNKEDDVDNDDPSEVDPDSAECEEYLGEE